LLIVGDDDKLRGVRKLLHQLLEALNVLVVQRGVNFVQDAERAGLAHKDGKQQCHGRKSFFSAGEQGNMLRLFAGRLRHNINAAFQHAVLLSKDQVCAATAKQTAISLLEVGANLREGLGKQVLRGLINFADGFREHRLGFVQVLLLVHKELQALVQLVVL